MKSPYLFIDTPALLIDREQMLSNIDFVIKKSKQCHVALRPHTKTHRMPALAKLCIDKGAVGITVAKIGEAEIMADNGIIDIFIANEIIGLTKYERIKKLHRKISIRIGIDGKEQIDQIQHIFIDEAKPLDVLMEIEVGENRSGLITDEQIIALGHYLKEKNNLNLIGVFSHEGHCYKASSADDCRKKALIAHQRTVNAANILRSIGHTIDVISVGSTPSLMIADIDAQVTEIRPGTFIFMDVGQGSAIGDFSKCAATVLTSVISRPTEERIVLDAGAKSLTSQNRSEGICTTHGYGLVKGSNNVRLQGVFDEHGIINDRAFHNLINIGDKIEIIPNHICPTCNLYERAYLVSKGTLIEEIPILCRGQSQ